MTVQIWMACGLWAAAWFLARSIIIMNRKKDHSYPPIMVIVIACLMIGLISGPLALAFAFLYELAYAAVNLICLWSALKVVNLMRLTASQRNRCYWRIIRASVPIWARMNVEDMPKSMLNAIQLELEK